MDDLTINELIKEAYRTARDKGWWEKPKSFGELIALCHSELSEALEVYREGYNTTSTWYVTKEGDIAVSLQEGVDTDKPEGIPSELADVIIRICDMAGYYDIDLERAIQEKMAYNKTRPHRHGGKVI